MATQLPRARAARWMSDCCRLKGHGNQITLCQGVILVLRDPRQVNADAPEGLRDVGLHPVRGEDHRLTGNPLHVPFEAQVALLGIG